MKRIVFFVAVLATTLAMSGARAATVQHHAFRNIDVAGTPAGGNWLHVMAFSNTVTTVGGSQTTTVQVCVEMGTNTDFDSGCGPATSFSLDPLLLNGSAQAVIPGRLGGILVTMQFTGTHVSTNPPFGDVELAPNPSPSATLMASIGRQGRGSATAISAALGTLSVSNVGASAYGLDYVTATS